MDERTTTADGLNEADSTSRTSSRTGKTPEAPDTSKASAAAAKTLGAKGEQTRAAILDAAVQRFGRDGYRQTSIADIARDAGVGGSVAYSYFPNKTALFLAALDEDTTALINDGLAQLIAMPDSRTWRDSLLATLLGALQSRPLVRRVLSGLEPDATERVIDLPALMALRQAVVDRITADQASGIIRADIDPVRIGNGATTVILTVLMATMQFGIVAAQPHASDIWALFDAALNPVDQP